MFGAANLYDLDPFKEFDSNLTFDKQINDVVGTSFFHLQSPAKGKPFLWFRDFETELSMPRFHLASIKVTLCIWTSVCHCFSQQQLVQNAAAQSLAGTC